MPPLAEFNQVGANYLPGHLGIVITQLLPGEVHAELTVRPELMAPNGFLHVGSVVTLADTCAGYGCVNSLPEGAVGFATLELKSNHFGTAREGTVACVAKAVHVGARRRCGMRSSPTRMRARPWPCSGARRWCCTGRADLSQPGRPATSRECRLRISGPGGQALQ